MQLKSIKLAGFKSFADPIVIPIPGRRIGIVGPNGCGKSNVIDAIRWVMGESQARQLRGESLQDVIFAGTTRRHSLGRASVELIFEQVEGTLSGHWGTYSELSVKRVIQRDGVSHFYLNQTMVRRRDIQDLFLGTGLGPRAYAVIEQGMIARIVESKPEEMRVFLEEAAGVSRYRERRRETESRLVDSRENLARTQDIQTEIEQQLKKLLIQAEQARRYNDLQEKWRQTQQLIVWFRFQEAQKYHQSVAQNIQQHLVLQEQQQAYLRELEKNKEAVRVRHEQLNQAITEAQKELYQANLLVTRSEHALQQQSQEQSRLDGELQRLISEQKVNKQRQGEHTHLRMRLQAEWQKVREDLIVLNQDLLDSQKYVQESRRELERQRLVLEDGRITLSEQQSVVRVLQGQQQNVQKRIQQLEQRRAQWYQQKQQWRAPDFKKLMICEQNKRNHAVTLLLLTEHLKHSIPRQLALQKMVREFGEKCSKIQQEVMQCQSTIQSLTAIQRKIHQPKVLSHWLTQYFEADQGPLWSRIHVEKGWERAVEAVLGPFMQAYPVANWDLLNHTQNFPQGLFLYLNQTAEVFSSNQEKRLSVDPEYLCSKIHSSELGVIRLIEAYFGKIRIRERCPSAEEMTPQLGSWVTQEGHCGTGYYITIFNSQIEASGALERQRELQELEQQHQYWQVELAQYKRRHQEWVFRLAALDGQINTWKLESTDVQREQHRLELDLMRLHAEQLSIDARLKQIESDGQLISQELKDEQDSLQQVLVELTPLMGLLAESEAQLKHLRQQCEQSEETYLSAQELCNSLEKKCQQYTYQELSLTEKYKQTEKALNLLIQQENSVNELERATREKKQQIVQVDNRAQLEQSLKLQVAQQERLGLVQNQLSEIVTELRLLEESHWRTQQQQPALLKTYQDLLLAEQEWRLMMERCQADLMQDSVNLEHLKTLVVPLMTEESLGEQAEFLKKNIQNIGAVNLAALLELETTQQRKNWLDAQVNDLNEALQTLESVIKKIDQETRDQMRETFERVNQYFSGIFETLFGGGNARLEWSGEDILSSGILVVAQPPGKKNSSLHLLSGGEKTLTALSLVFSFFQLNPAPFCILDEVDAPLDDNNAYRFTEMVKRMSEQTQFLFITHNKIAMEMAEQLIGITMVESGVSRMVSVDVAEAVRLVEPMLE